MTSLPTEEHTAREKIHTERERGNNEKTMPIKDWEDTLKEKYTLNLKIHPISPD